MRRSGQSPSSGSSERLGQDPLVTHILDLLVDAPNPISALYGSLIRNVGYEREAFTVERLFAALREMRRLGWIELWQTDASGSSHIASEWEIVEDQAEYSQTLPAAEEYAYDETGLWSELTPLGRRQWNVNAPVKQEASWVLFESAEDNEIRVLAADRVTAQRALELWLRQNPRTRAVASRATVSTVDSFSLRDGTVIEGGIELRCPLEPE